MSGGSYSYIYSQLEEEYAELTGKQEDILTGRWIIDKYKVTLTCSECGKQYTQFPLVGSWQPEWNYCPNCGACMEGVEE